MDAVKEITLGRLEEKHGPYLKLLVVSLASLRKQSEALSLVSRARGPQVWVAYKLVALLPRLPTHYSLLFFPFA
jgi:hypothetical protein